MPRLDAPFAWLEPDTARMSNQQPQIEWPNAGLAKVNSAAESELVLRCSVAANPLGQNTILQIEWLKDGRKLAQQSSSSAQISQMANKQQAGGNGKPRLHIERANHLHMPLASSSSSSGQLGAKNGGNQLASGSKLIGSSWLSISSLNKSDSANYTCQFKLIPAPPSGQTATAAAAAAAPIATHPANHQQQPFGGYPAARSELIRITSGQANQTVQVDVIEGKPRTKRSAIVAVKIQFCLGSDGPTAVGRLHWAAGWSQRAALTGARCHERSSLSCKRVAPVSRATTRESERP